MSSRRKSSKGREEAAIRRSRSEAHEEAQAVAGELAGSQIESDARSLDFTRRLRRLYEISTVLTRFESVERTVPEALGLVAAALPLRSAILLLADEPGETREIIWQGERQDTEGLQAAEAYAHAALRYFMRSGDPRESGGGEAPAPRPKENFIALPLAIANRPIFGVLQLEGAASFDETDLLFVNAVVNQLAIAIDRQEVVNAKQASAEASVREQRLLADASAAVGSSLDYRKTLAALAHATVPQLADLCLIAEVEKDGSVLRREVVFADPTMEGKLADRMRGLSLGSHAWVLESQRSLLISEIADLAAEDIDNAEAEAEALRDAGIESMMVVPLVVRGQRLGVLTFARLGSNRCYSRHDLDLAEEIARRAAIAIDNARLYEQALRATLSLENLLAVASHDLKNPLAAILLNLTLLQRNPELAEGSAARKQLMSILRAAKRMNLLLEDLLQSEPIEGGRLSVEPVRLELPHLLAEAIEAQQPLAANKSQKLELVPCGELPAVLVDSARIFQVLANLIGNAIKFTPEGGSISVRATTMGDVVRVSVTDNGSGISEDDLPQVFDRMWRVDRGGQRGTGLGLFIVKELVEAHGGKVWAESRVGVGSTFHFTVPVATAK